MNDPFLAMVLQLLPLLIVLAFVGLALRVGLVILAAILMFKNFNSQLNAVVAQLPPPNVPPPAEWLRQAGTVATKWQQMNGLQQQRMANRKAEIMSVFTAARVPFTPPPGW